MQFKLCKLCVRVLFFRLMLEYTRTKFLANIVCICIILPECRFVSFRFVELLNFPYFFRSFFSFSLHGYHCLGVKFSWVRRSFIMLNSIISNNSKFCDMCFINAIENGIEQSACKAKAKN